MTIVVASIEWVKSNESNIKNC